MSTTTEILDAINDSRQTEPGKYIWGRFTPDKEGVGFKDLPLQEEVPVDSYVVVDDGGPVLKRISLSSINVISTFMASELEVNDWDLLTGIRGYYYIRTILNQSLNTPENVTADWFIEAIGFGETKMLTATRVDSPISKYIRIYKDGVWSKWVSKSGMTIGTVFISDLIAPNNPPGALEYNGTEVTNADQQYPEFWYTWLTTGKFATGTYAQYADAISANGGTCPFYALDVDAKKFKTPTWADGVFPSSAITSSEVNTYKPAGLPNITASTEGLAPCSNPTGAFSTAGGGFVSLDGIANWGVRLKFDASKSNSIYGASTTVQPVSVRKRWFVQVTNSI